MQYKDIYDIFEKGFPQYNNTIGICFPNGKNSIRIRRTNGQEMVFTYNSKTDWKLESVDSFINSMKGGSKM